MARSFTDWIVDERRFLNPREQRQLRRAARAVRDSSPDSRCAWHAWFLVELLFESGLRIFEARGLSCGDLKLHFRRPGVFVRYGKGGRPRYVRVRREFCRTAKAFLAWRQKSGDMAGADSPLFPRPDNSRPVTVRALQKRFSRTCRRAGIAGHSPHHCRHTYACELLRSSHGNLRLVQRQLGHRKITTTQIYADIFDSEMDAAIGSLYRRRGARRK